MKRTVLFFALIALLGLSPLFADDTLWTRLYRPSGDGQASAVRIQGTDVFVSGSSRSGNVDAFVIKYSGAGAEEWVATIDLGAFDMASCLVVGPDNQPVVGIQGEQTGTDAPVAQLVKLNPSGETLWTRSRSNAMILKAAVDGNSRVYFGGACGDPMPMDSIWVAAYEPNGTQAWSRTLKLAMIHEVTSICIDSRGDPYLTASLSDTTGISSILIKLSGTNGDTLFTRRYSQALVMRFQAIAAAESGLFRMLAETPTGTALFKADGAGDTVWTVPLPSGGVSAPDLAVDASGTCFVAYADADEDIKLNKYDADGGLLGTLRAPHVGFELAISVALGSDNNPAATGMSADTIATQVITVKFSGTPGIEERPAPAARPCAQLGTVTTSRHLGYQTACAGTYRFQLFDAAGNLRHTEQVALAPGRHSIGLPLLANGVYLVRVEGPAGTESGRLLLCH